MAGKDEVLTSALIYKTLSDRLQYLISINKDTVPSSLSQINAGTDKAVIQLLEATEMLVRGILTWVNRLETRIATLEGKAHTHG